MRGLSSVVAAGHAVEASCPTANKISVGSDIPATISSSKDDRITATDQLPASMRFADHGEISPHSSDSELPPHSEMHFCNACRSILICRKSIKADNSHRRSFAFTSFSNYHALVDQHVLTDVGLARLMTGQYRVNLETFGKHDALLQIGRSGQGNDRIDRCQNSFIDIKALFCKSNKERACKKINAGGRNIVIYSHGECSI